MKHYEACVLIGQPLESGERDEAVRADDDQSFQPVTHTSEPDSSTLWADAILNFEMATLHSHFDAVAKKRENATSANRGFAGKGRLR
jgi:hypothetical protein